MRLLGSATARGACQLREASPALPITVRCQQCGQIGRIQVRPPMPAWTNAARWMEESAEKQTAPEGPFASNALVAGARFGNYVPLCPAEGVVPGAKPVSMTGRYSPKVAK